MAGIQLYEGKIGVWNRAGECPPECGRSWGRGLESQRREDIGDTSIHALAMERLDEERPSVVGGYQLNAGLAVCVANSGAMRRALVSPLRSHSATQWVACERWRPRRRHDGDHAPSSGWFDWRWGADTSRRSRWGWVAWDSGLQALCLILRVGRFGQTHCRWLPSVCPLWQPRSWRTWLTIRRRSVVWQSWSAGWITKGSWADQSGRTSETVHDLRKCSLPNLASGSTTGSTTDLLLPNTITGRAWCLLSRLPRTRLIYAPTQNQAPVPSCLVARPVASSRYNWRRSECWLWRDCAFRSMSLMHSVNAVRLWTTWAVAEGRAPIQVVWCGEWWLHNAPWPKSAGKREPSFDSTLSWGTWTLRSQRTMTGPSKFWRQDFRCSTGLSWQPTSHSETPRTSTERSWPEPGGQGGQVCGSGGWKPVLVIALETGGRWSGEAVEFIDMMAGARAREVLPIIRRSVHLAWRRRLMRMLSVSCARAFANSRVAPGQDVWSGTDGAKLDLADLLGETWGSHVGETADRLSAECSESFISPATEKKALVFYSTTLASMQNRAALDLSSQAFFFLPARRSWNTHVLTPAKLSVLVSARADKNDRAMWIGSRKKKICCPLYDFKEYQNNFMTENYECTFFEENMKSANVNSYIIFARIVVVFWYCWSFCWSWSQWNTLVFFCLTFDVVPYALKLRFNSISTECLSIWPGGLGEHFVQSLRSWQSLIDRKW